MRLLTHNHLRCQRRDVVHGFPLRIQLRGESSVVVSETEFDVDFIRHIVPTLEARLPAARALLRALRVLDAFGVGAHAQWQALCEAATSIGIDALPPSVEGGRTADFLSLRARVSHGCCVSCVTGARPSGLARCADGMLADEGFLRAIHHVLLDVHVMRAELVCPESGQVFPVEDGIPNMTLGEDQVAMHLGAK